LGLFSTSAFLTAFFLKSTSLSRNRGPSLCIDGPLFRVPASPPFRRLCKARPRILSPHSGQATGNDDSSVSPSRTVSFGPVVLPSCRPRSLPVRWRVPRGSTFPVRTSFCLSPDKEMLQVGRVGRCRRAVPYSEFVFFFLFFFGSARLCFVEELSALRIFSDLWKRPGLVVFIRLFLWEVLSYEFTGLFYRCFSSPSPDLLFRIYSAFRSSKRLFLA